MNSYISIESSTGTKPESVVLGTNTGTATFQYHIDTIPNKPFEDDTNLNYLVQGLSTETEFAKNVRDWLDNRPRGVGLSALVNHDAYRRIIGMGQRAVPLLLGELERSPDHWFVALTAITNENPVSIEAQGKLYEMAAAWLEWGREREYRW